jgi:putative membrane protein
MKITTLLPFAAVALVATPATAQVMTPAEYVATAGASDLYERQSSQMVLESTQDPKVRAFATMMLRDHAKSTADIKAAAARSRVRATPPKLNPTQTEKIAELRAATGPARDQAYVAQQRASHNQALDVHKAYSTEGTAPALKRVATAIVPVVTHHVEMLKTM